MDSGRYVHVILAGPSGRAQERVVEALAENRRLRVSLAPGHGQELLRRLSDETPDVLVLLRGSLDFTLLDMLRQVREASPDLCILVMGPVREFSFTVRCLEAGADAFIDTLTQLDRLLSLIHRLEAPVPEFSEEVLDPEGLLRLASSSGRDFNHFLQLVWTSAALLEDAPAEERRKMLDMLRLAAGDASAVCRKLSSASTGEILQTSETDLVSLLRQYDPFLRNLLGRGVKLEMDLPALPCRVQASHPLLRQIFSNLALNARYAMEGSGIFKIALRRAPSRFPVNGEMAIPWIELRVTDTGPGISAQDFSRIAEPFSGAPAGTSWTMLGLFSVQQAVLILGGCLEVENRPLAGSAFIIRLPEAALEDASFPTDSSVADCVS